MKPNEAIAVHYVKGFPSLAAFIASDKGKTTHIYRRFNRLAARNLLHLQSELAELEAKQDALDNDDLRGSTEQKQSVRNFEILRDRASHPENVREVERLRVIEDIRKKLKEYRKAHLI
jgi:hypothetical protein